MRSIKVVLIGDSGVGKTAIYQRLDSNTFIEDHLMTIGAAYTKITIDSALGPIEVGIWDTAGQEKFRNIVPMYFQRADYAFIVYDISSRETFNNLEVWYQMVKEKAPVDAKIIIIGNKSDLESRREVSFEEGTDFATEIESLFIETSAKTGQGIELIHEMIAKQEIDEMSKKLKKARIHTKNNDGSNVNIIYEPRESSCFC
jgi:small GTP-binding protein